MHSTLYLHLVAFLSNASSPVLHPHLLFNYTTPTRYAWMKHTHTAPLLFPHLSLHCVYKSDLACSYTWELLTSRRKIEWESWLLWRVSGMHHHQDARFYVFHSPLLTQSTGCLKKTEIHRIKYLQIGFPPCYRQTFSKKCFVCRFFKKYRAQSL